MAKFIEVTNVAYSFDDDDEIINEDEPLPMFVNIDDIVWFAESRISGTYQTTTLVLRNYKTTFYVLEEPRGILSELRRLQCNQEMI